MGGHRYSPETVAEWVRSSCAAQGVPVVVRDPVVLADVAVLLTGRPAPVRGPLAGSPPPAAPITAAK